MSNWNLWQSQKTKLIWKFQKFIFNRKTPNDKYPRIIPRILYKIQTDKTTPAMQDNWFTIEQPAPDVFSISEYRHWEETHCYLITGTERAILIDTGLGVSNILPEVRSLTTLPISVLTTHVHFDHIGGHGCFSDFCVHENERKWIEEEFPLSSLMVRDQLTKNQTDFPDGFDPLSYTVFKGKPAGCYQDGDHFDLGGRELIAVHTPGHSPGHCCFYEPSKGYLFTGDLIYRGCLYAHYPSTDPLLFRESVHKILQLSPERIFPGHHDLDISPDLIKRTAEAFDRLYNENGLVQGSGTFSFGEFQIRI